MSEIQGGANRVFPRARKLQLYILNQKTNDTQIKAVVDYLLSEKK